MSAIPNLRLGPRAKTRKRRLPRDTWCQCLKNSWATFASNNMLAETSQGERLHQYRKIQPKVRLYRNTNLDLELLHRKGWCFSYHWWRHPKDCKSEESDIFIRHSKSGEMAVIGIEMTTEDLTLMKFVRLALMHPYKKLDMQGRFVLFNNMSLVMVVTRAIASNYWPRNLSLRS